MSKKFFSIFVSTATIVAMLGISPSAVNAQSVDINALLQQIAALQAQIAALQGSSSVSSGYTFTRNLTVGATGEDVKMLQKFLNAQGYKVSESGAGSPGNESTYFGTKTRTALGKWQAANGISPTAGYFGPLTRGKVNGSGGVPTGGTQPPVVTPATGLSVTLASDNPKASALVSSASASASRVPVLAFNLTAGVSGGVTVTDLNFKKEGFIADSSISNAYLLEDGKVVAQYSSISGGVISFTGINLMLNAGQNRKLWLGIDPATNLTAGNTVSFSLTSAKALDAGSNIVTGVGAFPLMGNTFTITSVSNPGIATLTIASSSVGTSVYAGTQDVPVSQWTFTGGTSALNLKSINFKVVGSANKNDIKNVKLKVNGTQVGPTLPAVAADGSAYFNLGASPAKINTGSNNVQVFADIMGSPSFTFQFELLNSYDVEAIDSVYSVPVSPTINGGSGIQITILQGALTVSQASDTPTGNIVPGGSGTPFAKFTIYAAGEPVKVKWLTFGFTLTNVTTANLDSEIKNVSLTDDAGGQVGSTINSLVTTVTCTDGTMSASTTSPINCFGSSGSPISYIIPANTTRVLTLRGDVQSTATFDTIVARLLAGTSSNFQGITSSQTSNSSAATGASLTLVSSALTIAQNSAVGSQTYSAGTTGARIGSYSLSASSAEGVNLTTITLGTSASSTIFSNLRIKVGGASFGITQSSLTASASYTFSGTANIPAGQTKVLDVYADIIAGTSANTYTIVTDMESCSGSGATTFTAISCNTANGQNLVVAGQATISVSADSGQANATQLVMGSTGNSLATFRFTETTNIEDVKVTDLYIFQSAGPSTTVKSAFSNLSLYNGGTLLGTAGAATAHASTSNPGSGYYYKFNFGTPIVVPRANSVLLTLRGDVASYSSSGATDNTSHSFRIATTTDTVMDTASEVVVALGNTSNATSAITLSPGSAAPYGNAMTVLRTKIGVTASLEGSATNRVRAGTNNLAKITFSADAAGSLAVNTLVVTFAGNGPSAAAFLDGVTLVDEGGTSLGTGNTTSTACSGGTTTCTKTFLLGATTAGLSVSQGGTKIVYLKVNDSNVFGGVANQTTQALSAYINAITDVYWTDGLDSSARSTIGLPSSTVVPISLAAVTYQN